MQSVEQVAQEVFERNWREDEHGGRMLPHETIYPNQWLWDSCAVALGLRHVDAAKAQSMLRRLTTSQWDNGMLPNMIFGPDSVAWHYPLLWAKPRQNGTSDLKTSGITQPPLLAEAVWKVGEVLPDDERRRWFAEMIGSISKFHHWLYDERDVSGDGLITLLHPWESGMDNSPVWTAHMQNWRHAAKVNGFLSGRFGSQMVRKLRHDTGRSGLPLTERSSVGEGIDNFQLQQQLRMAGYDSRAAFEKTQFGLEDVGFNSIFIRANRYLQSIADELGIALSPSIVQSMAQTEASLEHLWDPQTQTYLSRDPVTKRHVPRETIASLLPLYTGVIDEERACAVHHKLSALGKFAAPFPVPTVPISDPEFNAVDFWRGPAFTVTSNMLREGAEHYGYRVTAAHIGQSIVNRVTEVGAYEYFSPLDGSGHGAPNFSWTAANALDIYATMKP